MCSRPCVKGFSSALPGRFLGQVNTQSRILCRLFQSLIQWLGRTQNQCQS